MGLRMYADCQAAVAQCVCAVAGDGDGVSKSPRHLRRLSHTCECVQIAKLPWRNVCALWQEMVTALAHCLATCAEQPGRRLTRLLLEAGAFPV